MEIEAHTAFGVENIQHTLDEAVSQGNTEMVLYCISRIEGMQEMLIQMYTNPSYLIETRNKMAKSSAENVIAIHNYIIESIRKNGPSQLTALTSQASEYLKNRLGNFASAGVDNITQNFANMRYIEPKMTKVEVSIKEPAPAVVFLPPPTSSSIAPSPAPSARSQSVPISPVITNFEDISSAEGTLLIRNTDDVDNVSYVRVRLSFVTFCWGFDKNGNQVQHKFVVIKDMNSVHAIPGRMCIYKGDDEFLSEVLVVSINGILFYSKLPESNNTVCTHMDYGCQRCEGYAHCDKKHMSDQVKHFTAPGVGCFNYKSFPTEHNESDIAEQMFFEKHGANKLKGIWSTAVIVSVLGAMTMAAVNAA